MTKGSHPYVAGRRFGRLEVIEPVGYAGPWRVYRCRCDCGNEASVPSRYLCTTKKSCGCLLRESRSKNGQRNLRDITGMRSGRLVAISLSEQRDKRGRRLWNAKCDCGTEKLVRASQITGRYLASCGCAFGVTIRPEHLRKTAQARRTYLRKTDFKFALNSRIGNAIRASLKGGKKGGHWEKLLGYNLKELIRHLRKTMPHGFTWDNYLAGKLHVDHIIPLAAHNFRSSSDLDFHRAWALSNLQLLPVAENFAKHDRLSSAFQPAFSWGDVA